ncbi:SNF2-related protein [Microbulbifer aggregans]|uniref:DEAD/DEAH box helicase n=1 Tax=Microbulbifer aggregans TaxID=1769779 RepID=UPI001CFC5D7A|nr:SNF2-related protein [Microbulbifer aggregans]
MITFRLSDIQRMADSRSFARGQDYFERGRVLEAYYDEAKDIYHGRVKGSARHIYRVELDVDAGRLVGLCSCPVSLNCKHAVATALKLYRDAQIADTSEEPAQPTQPGKRITTQPKRADWQQWLAELPPAPRPKPAPLEYGRHYLVYFLEPDHRFSPPRLRLALRKGYLKKDGNWSQLRYFQPDTAYLGWNRPSHLLDEDVDILQLLPRTGASGQLELRGESGHRALVHLLNCGRFYYDDTNICRGTAKALDWHWQASGDKQQLTPVLEGIDDPTQWLPIPVSPPAYLDMETATIGDILTSVPGNQLGHLCAMPPVAEPEMMQMAVQMRQLIPREQLPLPVEPKFSRVTEFAPCLTLLTVDLGQHRLPAIKLYFDYAGFLLPAPYSCDFEGTEEHRERAGHHYQITRDIDAEHRHCDEIYRLGFYLMRDELGGQRDIWLQEVANPNDIPAAWNDFLTQTLPELQERGWRVETDPGYHFKVQRADFSVNVADAKNNWFELGVDLTLPDGEKLKTATLLEHWLESGTPDELTLNLSGDWVQVDTKPLQSIRSILADLLSQKKLDKPMLMPPFQAAQLADIPELDQREAPLTHKLMQRLRDFSGLENIPAPKGLNADLRSYQQDGLNWLVFLQRYGFGGILADDMGLGKTLQTLALVQHMKEQGALGKPALVIAPTSLTGNWLHEAAHFAPELKTTLIHGPDRDPAFKQVAKSDLVITTYPLLVRDKARYDRRKFSLVVLDEAQAIKNPTTKIAECVRSIKSEFRLCLTGTPLENHLGELWSLMDFALPGLLGGRKQFQKLYRTPIENDGDAERQQELARKVSPFMLRRTKRDVATELPPKTETVQYVELPSKQRALYESVRASMEKRIRDLVASQGIAKSQIEFLDALLKLRQACIDPRLVKLYKADGIQESAKLDWLAESMPQLLEEGRNILVFSQFTQVLKLIEAQLNAQGIAYTKLTGQTRKRQQAIDAFQNGEVRVFLISLKAGGSGLNLTAADVVIHMDPWWNPAVENQATDRAYRIGQDKPVFVYKLVAEDTVEERIHQMQQQKQALADSLFDATRSSKLPGSSEDLLALLS